MMEHSVEYMMFTYELSRLHIDHRLCQDYEMRLQIARDIDLLERAIGELQ